MKKILILLGVTMFLVSCSDSQRKPSNVFMPDMYYSEAYEPYAKSNAGYPDPTNDKDVYLFVENQHSTALEPVENTVPRTALGTLPYTIPNTPEGYEESRALKSPLDSANYEADVKRGELLFNQACAACHGVDGDGKGSIVQSGAYVGVPNYKDRDVTVGIVHHVIMYGKNAMGSYASHFEEPDRWRVAEYVMKLKNK